jgi:glucose-1-phosphate thymidylyltransferase
MVVSKNDRRLPQDLIGLLPAAGKATRISPLPCSKEIFPIGFGPIKIDNNLRPKVVSHYLLENMQRAGVRRAYIVLRSGKWDIPAYFGNGDLVGLHLGYLTTGSTQGVPYTLDQAYPFVNRFLVAMGFPDIILYPEDAFTHLVDRQVKSDADIVLGLFPASQSHKVDMILLDKDQSVREIHIKPSRTHLIYTWLIAVWTPTFSHFMHQFLLNVDRASDSDSIVSYASKNDELFMGDVIQAAIDHGLVVDKVIFRKGTYIDIGTREDMIAAMQNHPTIGGVNDHN